MYRATPTDGVAWVTGASAGIGRATALELARRGWRVAVTARSADDLRALAAEAAGKGWRIDVFPGDVVDRAAQADIVARIETGCGPIALAFLNAGGVRADAPGDFFGENFRWTFALNFDGVINGLTPLMTRMKDRRRGQIAVMASIAGYGGLPMSAAYCASKSAVIVMAESMRAPLERVGVTLQVVCPGFVATNLLKNHKGALPFLMDAETAARRICDGFERKGFEIEFPRRLAWIAKAVNMLPYGLYFRIMKSGGA
jgi:NAD(P)-dependent dehydrogenase (short-subunit alcohol dehydrogenase family)